VLPVFKIYFDEGFSNQDHFAINKKYLQKFEETPNIAEADIIKCGTSWLDTDMFVNCKYVVCPCTNINHVNHLNDNIISLVGQQHLLKDVVSTAEHTMFLILKCLSPSNSMLPGRTLKDKRVGILGYGRIGKQVKKLCEAFGATVAYYDPFNSVFYRDDVIGNCDIVTIHATIKKNQDPIIGEKELKMMKDGAILVNTSRREAVDQAAVVKYSEKLSTFAQDWEGLSRNDYACPVYFTNHLGGKRIEDMIKTSNICFDLLIDKLEEDGWNK
jgi:lactate dehydrogenase-like 2-hydroxyacid dehydrogenase